MQAKRKLKEMIGTVSIIWMDLSNCDTLRKEEELTKNLEDAHSEYTMLLQGEEAHGMISEVEYLCKQAVELRMKISERIF